jgi:hypothetical protein
MVAMPSLPEEKMKRGEPSDIARGILAKCDPRLSMADAVDGTYRVEKIG